MCKTCGKVLPGQPFWMVVQPGTEDRYFCRCNSWHSFQWTPITDEEATLKDILRPVDDDA